MIHRKEGGKNDRCAFEYRLATIRKELEEEEGKNVAMGRYFTHAYEHKSCLT